MRLVGRALLLLSLFAWQVCTALPSIDHCEIKADHRGLSIVFRGATSLSYKSFMLVKPDRLVIDFYRTKLGKINFEPLLKDKQELVRARTSESPQKTRVVFELSQSMQYQSHLDATQKVVTFDLKSDHKPLKPLSHIAIEKRIVEKRSSDSFKSDSLKSHTLKKSVKNLDGQVRAYRPIIVMIDPGHGGKDPGASGSRRYKEKDIVFGIARKLAHELNHTFGYTAKLTRSGDYYVSLRDRLNIARQSHADVFISIHADAYKNTRAHGASVFALSERGATSEAARWLAERENNSELMGGVKLNNKGSILRSVLLDLSQTATSGASLEMGSEVLSSLGRVTKLHKGQVEQAAFVVLKSPDIPSLLIETGFISNRSELRHLANHRYQQRMAKAISQGVQKYFNRQPPRDTQISASKQGKLKHVVVKGDNLTLVANRYSTTPWAIKQVNHLASDHLDVGQVLLLPVHS